MKINRISESIGLISDEISSRAIEAFEKTSEKQSGISAEKPRVIREEKSRKTPFVIALAGLCAAAAVAVPFAMNKIGKNEIVAHESISGAAESAHDETDESILNTVSQSTPEEQSWSLPEGESIAVKVKDVKITLTDDKQLSVRDDENPNVRIFKIYIDKSKANTHAFVLNKDGTYKTFAGNDISKEDILKECPDGVSGVMWAQGAESALYTDEDSIFNFNGTFEYKGNDLWSYEYWYSNDEEAKWACMDYNIDGKKQPLYLIDNGDGTYSVEGFLNVMKQNSEKFLTQQATPSITAKVDRLKLTFDGDEISAVPDEINANVNYFTLKFDKSKGDTFAIVTNDDGTFKTFAGNNMSEEEILRECPDGVFGMMWNYKDGGEQWKVILGFEDFDMARNGVSLFRDGTTICYQFWVSNDKSIASEIHSRIKPGTGGYLEIKDNGNGTFSAYMDITQ